MAASHARSYVLAAEVATEIVLQKLEILLSHPACVKCLWQTRAKDAKEKLAMIPEILSAQDRAPRAMEWFVWLLHAMSDAEEFIDKFHFREARKRYTALHMAARPFAALVSKYKLRRDLSILVNKMEELCDEKFLKEDEGKRKNEPASSSSHSSVPWQGKKLARLTNFCDQQAPMNFVAKKEKIMERIKMVSQGIEGTSILGGQGTGKTFLARWVYSQAKYMDYERRAWVHVSGSLEKREFLLEILKQVEKLEREMKDMDIVAIRKILLMKLAKTKGFLLVLDDVQPSDWPLLQELAMSMQFFSAAVRIITTTQDNMIARSMDTSQEGPIKLENLDKEESRRMLAGKLHGVFDGQRLSNEEEDILKLCPPLPLCISLLGGFLSNAGEHERAALAKEGSMMTLLDLLQLSCHKLPIHLKPCVIYMALFPVAFPIPMRRLVRLWLAEGLLDMNYYDIERKRTSPPEDVGERFILELVDRNVIDVVSWRADGSPKACQMLTSLYDMIRRIAMSTGFIHIHEAIRNPTGKQLLPAQLLERTKVRWLAEHTSIVTDSHGGSLPNLYLGHVRSFLAFYMKRGILTKDISTFLRNMTSETAYSLLRVLDLEGVHKPSLQGVLHKLVLLRYLGLRSTVLDSLPSEVADLYYLETLDIKHTNITSLPSSLWKARNLRHLHLNWFYINLNTILKACSNNVMALTKLQTLNGLVIGEVNSNLMTGHMNSLTTLKLFLRRSGGDTSGVAGETVAGWISQRLTNLQSLTFGVTQKAKPAKEAKAKKEDTEAAEPTKEAERTEGAKPATSPLCPLPKLSLAKEHHSLLELYLLGQLNKPIWTELLPGSLRVLTLSDSKVEIDMMAELGGLLRNLRTLRLLANSFLGTSLTFIKDGFPSLVILRIWKLPRLETVTIEGGAMPHLKELEFRRLDMMKNVERINECKELENICVVFKKDAKGFVDHLKNGKGKWTNLYEREDTETSKFAGDDDSRDKGEDASH